jgi:hypothetical protein
MEKVSTIERNQIYPGNITDGLQVFQNQSLINLKGLDSVDSFVGYVKINDNPQLAECSISLVCEHLNTTAALISIQNNAQGCNNKPEVLAACTSISTYDPLDIFSLSIAPNPTNDHITLQYTLSESAESEVLIINAQGMVVQKHLLSHQSAGDYALPFSLAGLPAGLYFVQVRAGDSLGLGKVVVVR